MGRRCLLGMLAAGLLFAALAMAKNSPQNAASSRVDRILEGMGPLGARGGMPQGQTIDARHIARTARGYVGTLVAPPGQHFKGHAVVPGRPADTARDFLKKYRDEFGMRGPTSDLTLKGVDTRAKHSHVQFLQTYGDLPVYATGVIVQLDPQGGVEHVSCDIMTDDETLDFEQTWAAASITAAEAQRIATGVLLESHPGHQFQAEPPVLMVYAPAVVGNAGPARLVWQTQVRSVPEPLVAEEVLADAATGETALRYSFRNEALYRKIYLRAWILPWLSLEASATNSAVC